MSLKFRKVPKERKIRSHQRRDSQGQEGRKRRRRPTWPHGGGERKHGFFHQKSPRKETFEKEWTTLSPRQERNKGVVATCPKTSQVASRGRLQPSPVEEGGGRQAGEQVGSDHGNHHKRLGTSVGPGSWWRWRGDQEGFFFFFLIP